MNYFKILIVQDPLHIIARFEIEKDLIEGKISAKDLPEIWNDKIKQYLNVDVKNDSKGCLQDIHWSCGCLGYFPTYTLGNLFAAQYFTRYLSDKYKEIYK